MNEDELVTGVSLEADPHPATITGPDPAAARTDPAPTEVEGETEETEPEGTIHGTGGVAFIPKQALDEARKQARAVKETNKALTAEVETLRQKAQELDRLSALVEQARPVIEAVSKRPELYAQAQAPPPTPPGPLTPEEAVEYAKELDLYTPEGAPDAMRAQRIAAKHAAIARRETQAEIQPIRSDAVARQSAEMFVNVAQQKDAYGQTVDPDLLKQIWTIVPPDLSARPEVAAILQRVALAETLLQGRHKGLRRDAPATPVIPTESLGSPTPAPAPLSEIDEAFARAAGLTKSTFEKVASRYVPGAHNRLE